MPVSAAHGCTRLSGVSSGIAEAARTAPGAPDGNGKRLPDEVSPRMFDNPLLEKLSRVHPAVPPLVYLPVIGYCLVHAVAVDDHAVAAVFGAFLLGLVGWSLTEYLLHRFVFHFEPDTRWGRRLHFIIHGVHHDFPHDPMRLVMPPSVSVPLAALFFFGFRAAFGPEWSLPAFAGFLLGYLIYDMAHFHIHHHRSKNRLSLALRRYHYRHHFQQSDRGYGVTSGLWDYVFRTVPAIPRRRQAA
jgi:sterol desaturase/sphingolipid hydroxylase (fatty acid hydroxylase superfamily)